MKYYLTTPIYYPSDNLHIGNAYTTIVADFLARYKKMRGYDVTFLTGTDEHGQKIEKAAAANNVTPKEYVDKIVDGIKKLWKEYDINYDIFIRTTDEMHEKAVQKIFKKLYDQGDIYKGEYEGWYCTPCESFFTDTQLSDGNCPDCGRAVEKAKEESYFFRLSKYQDILVKHIEENPDFIEPKSRRNEMISNFLKAGLEDVAVSRTSFKWGVPVDFDPEHVIYVWFDAVSNYISALGYMSEDETAFKNFWPADVHIVGKEIIRFHTLMWPAMLLALGEKLPKKVYGHGWLTADGEKMSKSKGNIIDPFILSKKFGIDAIKYFLLREIVFGQDGDFSKRALISRINSDLANDLGNLVSRTVAMIEKYFNGKLPLTQVPTDFCADLISVAEKTVKKTELLFDSFNFSEGVAEIWNLVRRTNKYIDETTPWILAKNEAKKDQLAAVMYNLAESIRIINVLITPIMPGASVKIATQLNISQENMKWDTIYLWGKLPKDTMVTKGEIIFPRLDIDKELAELDEIIRQNREKFEQETAKNSENAPKEEAVKKEEITIDDFAKLDLKLGTVVQCEPVAKSDKLLKSQVQIGNETRQIVSGIAKYYSPEQMVGKKVVVVANLKPIKLRGEMSYGMILCAEDSDGNLCAITSDPTLSVADGATVR